MRLSHYLPIGTATLIALAVFGAASQSLLGGRTPLPSVEDCNCVVSSAVASYGRLDATGVCQPIACRICPETPGFEGLPSDLESDEP